MNQIKIGKVKYKLMELTERTSVVEISNYLITFNNETNKLRVFNKKEMDKHDITKGQLYNSED